MTNCPECNSVLATDTVTITLPDTTVVVLTIQYCTGCLWMTTLDFDRYRGWRDMALRAAAFVARRVAVQSIGESND